jgi:hypothetical protein
MASDPKGPGGHAGARAQRRFEIADFRFQIADSKRRLDFRDARAGRHGRGFTCWGQFIAMLFCQLGQAHSLREICGGLALCECKLRHPQV